MDESDLYILDHNFEKDRLSIKLYKADDQGDVLIAQTSIDREDILKWLGFDDDKK